MTGTPPAEVEVDEQMVTGLVARQCPAFSGESVELLGHGWDNWMFGLGEGQVVRLPRRAVAVPLLEHEVRHLPGLAKRLPIPVPAPLFAGSGDADYPWPWLIAPRFEGRNADEEPPAVGQALRLADFLLALHRPDHGLAPSNDHRGIALHLRDAKIRSYWDSLTRQGEPLPQPLVELWEQACRLPPPKDSVWLHGDLHYANVLVRSGEFSAIVDWGDVCSGDPATDLAAVWSLFDDRSARHSALTAYGADGDLICRAMGWAVSFGIILLSTGLADNPRHAAAGRAVLRRVCDDVCDA